MSGQFQTHKIVSGRDKCKTGVAEHHAVLCIDATVPPASLDMRYVVRNRGLYLHLTMLTTMQSKINAMESIS